MWERKSKGTYLYHPVPLYARPCLLHGLRVVGLVRTWFRLLSWSSSLVDGWGCESSAMRLRLRLGLIVEYLELGWKRMVGGTEKGRGDGHGKEGCGGGKGKGNDREAPRRRERVRQLSCLLTSSPISQSPPRNVRENTGAIVSLQEHWFCTGHVRF